MSEDFYIQWFYRGKKGRAQARVQKFQMYAYLQSWHHTPVLKFLLEGVWVASDFSISGSGNRFKKIPLLWWRCFVLFYSCKCSTSGWNACLLLWVTSFLEGTQLPYVLTVHTPVCLQCLDRVFFPLYLCFCLHHCDILTLRLCGEGGRRLLPPFTLISHNWAVYLEVKNSLRKYFLRSQQDTQPVTASQMEKQLILSKTTMWLLGWLQCKELCQVHKPLLLK